MAAHHQHGGRHYSTHEGSGSLHDLQGRRARREEAAEHVAVAVAWCLENSKGARAACQAGLCEESHESTLKRRLHDAKAANEAAAAGDAMDPPSRLPDDWRMILLPEEEELLLVWACICGQQGGSVTNEEMGRAVITLLRLRQERNAAFPESGQQVFPLSRAAQEAIACDGISAHWLSSFKARHDEQLQ